MIYLTVHRLLPEHRVLHPVIEPALPDFLPDQLEDGVPRTRENVLHERAPGGGTSDPQLRRAHEVSSLPPLSLVSSAPETLLLKSLSDPRDPCPWSTARGCAGVTKRADRTTGNRAVNRTGGQKNFGKDWHRL